jgi:DNA-binding XRE family transcriptional regulator
MKLKQSVFAHLIGTSDDTISLMERGKILPRLKTLCKISEHLKIPLSKLLDFQEKSRTGKSENQPLSALNLYLKTKLPQEVRLVHDLAKGIFNKVPSIYQKSGRKSFIMRDK